MRLGVVVACLSALGLALSGCVEIQNPPATQGASPPTVILIDRDGSLTTLSQAPTMPGPDSAMARAVSGNSTTASSSSSPTPAPEAEGDGEPDAVAAPNAPPVITGFNASKLTGQAPLNVTFRFAARDSEAQPLNYTLHFGDGTPSKSGMLPAGDPFHIYTGIGAKSAVLYVGDGQNVTSSSVSITVQAPPPPPPALHFSDETWMACQGCDVAANACLGFVMESSGIDCAIFELPAIAAGRSFVAWSDGDFALSVGVWFRDDCDPFGSPFDLIGFANPFGSDTEVRGTVPAGAGCAILYDDNPLPGSKLSMDIL